MGSEDENVTTKRLTAEELAEIDDWIEDDDPFGDDGAAFDRVMLMRRELTRLRAIEAEARLLAEAVQKYDSECGGEKNWNRMVALARRVLRPAKTGGRDA